MRQQPEPSRPSREVDDGGRAQPSTTGRAALPLDRSRGHRARVDVAEVLRTRGAGRSGLASAAELARHRVTASALSRAVLRGHVVRIRRGVYGSEPLPGLPRFLVTDSGCSPAYVAHVRAVLLAVPGAGAVGRTAAVLHGWGLLVEPRRVLDIGLPYGARPAPPGLRVRRCRATAFVVRTDGLRMSDPASTVVDCALELPTLEAVVVADSALRAGAVTLDQLLRAARDLSGRRDARRVRRVLALCDPGSGSVLETVLRVRLVLAGVDGFRTQAVLHEPGARPLRVDLAFDAQRLVVEADGSRWHQDTARDRDRDNRLARAGWRVLRYTWADVVHEPDRVVAQVREALGATSVVHLASGAGARPAPRAA